MGQYDTPSPMRNRVKSSWNVFDFSLYAQLISCLIKLLWDWSSSAQACVFLLVKITTRYFFIWQKKHLKKKRDICLSRCKETFCWHKIFCVLLPILELLSVTRISNSWPNTNMNIFVREDFTKYAYQIYSYPDRLPN